MPEFDDDGFNRKYSVPAAVDRCLDFYARFWPDARPRPAASAAAWSSFAKTVIDLDHIDSPKCSRNLGQPKPYSLRIVRPR